MPAKRLRLALVSVVLILAMGCSFISVRPVPAVPPMNRSSACPTYLPVFLDAVALPIWAGFGYFLDNFCISEDPSYCKKHVTNYIPAMIVGASALYGVWAVRQCNRKFDELLAGATGPLALPPAKIEQDAGLR